MPTLPTLLIVDDERATREGLRSALEEEFDVYTASGTEEALTILKSEPIQLMLTDLRLGGDSGMDLLQAAQAMPEPPVSLIMTAYGSVDTAVEAMRRGAWHFVTKPLNLDEVEMLLKRALRGRTLETENRQLVTQVRQTHKIDKLVGKSSVMNHVFDLIRQVAPTRATVLIEGESGTGKEVVANTVHHLSGRPAAKLVTVNCAALSPQLLESELFGHEKGAFTGAAQRRIGRFEQADGGTLFLDEIGEIDGATQVKLLRLLSERTIERVGSNTPIKVDVRVITATNKSLCELVDKGTFREDLFFRLNVVRIEMPQRP
jgi:two-component system response regulator AtoC